MLVSLLCYRCGPLKVIGQFSLNVDCSQSPIFSLDRRCRSLSPTGRHLGLLMQAPVGRGGGGHGRREKERDCNSFTLSGVQRLSPRFGAIAN